MNVQSLKTRFMGSYIFLLVLFIVQVPIIYFLIQNMGQKYSQVDMAGGLRKRAVELTEVLNRHIMTGDEALEKSFQEKKNEYAAAIGALRKGSAHVSAITDREILDRLDAVEREWTLMRSALDKAMESGDGFRAAKVGVESTTAPMAEKLDALSAAYRAQKDAGYGKNAELAAQLKGATLNLSYLAERYFISESDRGEVLSEINRVITDTDRGFDAIRFGSPVLGVRAPSNGAVAALVRDIGEGWAARRAGIVEAVRAKDEYGAALNALLNGYTPKIIAAAEALTKDIAGKAKKNGFNSVMVMVLSAVVSAAFVLVFMYLAKRHVIIPINRVKDAVMKFASGDLTTRTGVRTEFLGKGVRDEITALSESVDEMAEQMSSVIGRIADSSDHLASASEQLSTTSSFIADGADRQSSQTQNIAASMEEMSATVIEVANNSQQASESARTAKETASRGGAVVEEAIAAMREVAESTAVTADTVKRLGKSSEEIGTIVSVINEIADQTNLLALNAAIEAARAGEQGRGFAVVADEVRKLAERTTRATREIGAMIEAIQGETARAVSAMNDGAVKVENGVRLANEAGLALKEIVRGVDGVTDMIGHIATSAEEQSATTEEITQNMDSIAGVAKSNVAAVGEAAGATNELARLAADLKDLTSGFRLAKKEAFANPTEARAKMLPFRRREGAGNVASEFDPRLLEAPGV